MEFARANRVILGGRVVLGDRVSNWHSSLVFTAGASLEALANGCFAELREPWRLREWAPRDGAEAPSRAPVRA